MVSSILVVIADPRPGQGEFSDAAGHSMEWNFGVHVTFVHPGWN